ncbi:unnamed protein product [Echinostoma caproni]|uniref:PHD-type domain-containing protein n=1 Tax=Echinostoma caproni TaxID=27848 RepID=A0A183ARJ5_9TREM|nr:unnamed protein product [Echinostoma caproni]
MDTTAAISYTDISSSVTISTGKTSDIASADSSQVTAATAVNVSGSVRTNTSTSDAPTADNQLLAMLVAELACCECGKLTRQPQLEPDGKTMNANILVECVQCGALYHQMCHQPPVLTSSGTSHQDWRCGSCSTATAAATGGDHPQTTNQPTATLTATVTDVAASKTSASAVVSSSPSATDLGPTVGARKRKAGLQSVLSGTGFRRL